MDERESIREAALRRARRECPEAREAVRQMYDSKRWHRYWTRTQPVTDHQVARAVASVKD